MELQSITGTILQEAKETAELMIIDAQKKAETMIKKQKALGIKEAKAERLWILKKAESKADFNRIHKIANSKITSNWIVLSRKEEIISSVLSEAKKRLQDLTHTKKYLSILASRGRHSIVT